MGSFAFVILHYNAIADTIECVDSIVGNMSASDYNIVIVDNASPDGSGSLLSERYAADERITVILNTENGGFSKGNNIGFAYVKKHFNPDFIVMLNNDTLLLQPDFAALVVEEYKRSHFAVMGPLVETPGGDFGSNPVASGEKSAAHYAFHSFKVTSNLIMSWLGIESLYQRLKRKSGFKSVCTREIAMLQPIDDAMLHGCFWIFGRPYIDRFDGLNAMTFLYGEEPLLYHRLKINGLKSVYQPKIHIYHKEDRSTSTLSQSSRKRKIRRDLLGIKADWAVIRNRLSERPANQ